MSIVDNKILVEASITDLQTMFSTNDNDETALCQNANIKMWAKFRPIEFKSGGRTGSTWVKQIPDARRAQVAYGISCVPVWASRMLGQMLNFWSGYNTAYANIPDTIDQDGQTKIHVVPSGAKYWEITLPSTAARLADFVSSDYPATKGYYHGAEEPIGGLVSIDLEITPGGYLTFEFVKHEGGVSDGMTVTYEDLVACGMLYGFPNNANIYNYYFGVALAKLNSSGQPTGVFYVLTKNTSMVSFQQMGTGITAYVDDDSIEGTYKVFPFISDQLLRGAQLGTSDYYHFYTTTNTSGTYVALRDPETVNIRIRWAQVRVSYLSAYHDSSNYHIIRVDYKVINEMTDYPVTGLAITIEFLEYNGTVVYTGTDSIQRIESQTETATINYAHNFGNTGGDYTSKVVRVTVASLSGVVFYRSNISVMAAEILETPPTPPTPTP